MFFFSSRRRHTRYWRDWSSDVCSSDLRLIRSIEVSLAASRRTSCSRCWEDSRGSCEVWIVYAPFDSSEQRAAISACPPEDRKSTRLNSSHANISYAVFCLKNQTLRRPT